MKKDFKSFGFLTLAFGKKYRKLAKNLLISFRTYGNTTPFCVVTDKKDKNLLLYLLIIWFVMASIVPFIKFIVPQAEEIFSLMINTKIHFSPLFHCGGISFF